MFMQGQVDSRGMTPARPHVDRLRCLIFLDEVSWLKDCRSQRVEIRDQTSMCRHAPGSRGVQYDGGGLGKGGTVCLFVDGKKTGEGRVAATVPFVFSADDGLDVGEDSGAPVSPDYGATGNEFNGGIRGIQLAIAEAAEAADHLVSPDHAVHIAMSRQ